MGGSVRIRAYLTIGGAPVLRSWAQYDAGALFVGASQYHRLPEGMPNELLKSFGVGSKLLLILENLSSREKTRSRTMRKREVEKLAQIVAFLMKRKVGRDHNNYTKNLKLVYWANREALRRWERPITSDDAFAMPKGPALSLLLDLMKERAAQRFQEVWDQYFIRKDFNLFLESDPGTGFLSPRECLLLAEVQDKFKDYTYGRMIKFMHDPENVPEFSDPGDSSRPIALDETLEKLGKDDNQRAIIAKEVRYNENVAALFEE
jgi:hypothetical protein